MKVVWTNNARERLFEIEDYIISQGAPANAEQLIQRLIDRAKILVEFPNSGRVVPEYPSGDYRELIESSYRIVYRVKNDVIEIETVYESRRLLPEANQPYLIK